MKDTVVSVLQGVVVGGLTTAVLLSMGIYIGQQRALLGLLPVSLLLSIFRIRWICYAYSTAVLFGALTLLGRMDVVTASGLICMVGVLHCAEALLTAGASGTQRVWPVPFGVLLQRSGGLCASMPSWWPLIGSPDSLGVLPLTALMAFHCRAEGKRAASGWILGYGLVMIAMGLITYRFPMLLIPAYILQVALHEFILKKQ